MKFIKVKDIYGNEFIINFSQISVVWPPKTLMMTGVHENGSGMFQINAESMNRILELIENIEVE